MGEYLFPAITMKYILALTILCCILHSGVSIYCNTCTTNGDSPIWTETCGDPEPETDIQSCPGCYACATTVYDDGNVLRGFSNDASVQDGECEYLDTLTRCYCTDSLCNDSLCEDCVAKKLADAQH